MRSRALMTGTRSRRPMRERRLPSRSRQRTRPGRRRPAQPRRRPWPPTRRSKSARRPSAPSPTMTACRCTRTRDLPGADRHDVRLSVGPLRRERRELLAGHRSDRLDVRADRGGRRRGGSSRADRDERGRVGCGGVERHPGHFDGGAALEDAPDHLLRPRARRRQTRHHARRVVGPDARPRSRSARRRR